MPLKKRSQARMLALQALCLFDAIGDTFTAGLDAFLSDPHTLADLDLETPPPPTMLSFARRLATGTWEQHERYDELINGAATRWTVSRMPPVDRNILRLGTHELHERAADRPPEVIINEAVELVRRFADADSPAFVNGVLDAVRRRMDAETEEPSEPREGEHGAV